MSSLPVVTPGVPAPPPPEAAPLTGEAFAAQPAEIDLSRYRLEDWLSLGIFWLLGATVLYQFFTRYALNDSASWTEEIARYLLIGTVFVGAAIGVRKNNHVQVDFLYRVLPRRLMRPLAVVVDLLRVVFLVACVLLTVQLIARIGGSRMAVVDLPMGLVYGAVLAGFVLMAWRALQVGWANWRRRASVLEKPELADEAGMEPPMAEIPPSPPEGVSPGLGAARRPD